MVKDRIFISHSSKDIKIVRSFVENVLLLGLDIPSARVFCTGMEGHGVISGQYIPDRLRDEIQRSSLALLFISENYKASDVCLNELGAAWVTLNKESVIPILLPGIEFSQIGLLNIARSGIKIFDQQELLKLIQDCKEKLNPDYFLDKLLAKLSGFMSEFKPLNATVPTRQSIENTECFDESLLPFDSILRQAIPAYGDGLFEIHDKSLQNKILTKLSKTKLLQTLWYVFGGGSANVGKLTKLP